MHQMNLDQREFMLAGEVLMWHNEGSRVCLITLQIGNKSEFGHILNASILYPL